MTTGSTYKVVELVGTSSEGIDQAIEGAIARAGQTLNGLDWFEVKEIRGQIQVYYIIPTLPQAGEGFLRTNQVLIPS